MCACTLHSLSLPASFLICPGNAVPTPLPVPRNTHAQRAHAHAHTHTHSHSHAFALPHTCIRIATHTHRRGRLSLIILPHALGERRGWQSTRSLRPLSLTHKRREREKQKDEGGREPALHRDLLPWHTHTLFDLRPHSLSWRPFRPSPLEPWGSLSFLPTLTFGRTARAGGWCVLKEPPPPREGFPRRHHHTPQKSHRRAALLAADSAHRRGKLFKVIKKSLSQARRRRRRRASVCVRARQRVTLP